MLVSIPKSQVDFRAACFCHRQLIDIGFVCSVCLSVFCSFTPICTTCDCNFEFDLNILKFGKKFDLKKSSQLSSIDSRSDLVVSNISSSSPPVSILQDSNRQNEARRQITTSIISVVTSNPQMPQVIPSTVRNPNNSNNQNFYDNLNNSFENI